jgi:hypothetical protein
MIAIAVARPKAEQATCHVPLHFSRGDQRDLYQQNNHPQRHQCAVDVDQAVRQRSADHPGKKVGPGKSVEDCCPKQYDHRGKENPVCERT